MPRPDAVALREPAPAKLNLALHVRRRRDDGYHELETLFAFCTDGDWLTGRSTDADEDSFSLDLRGPFGKDLDARDNLVTKAWRKLSDLDPRGRAVEIALDKRLPIASGLGGGSADAAATLRLLTALWRLDPVHASRIASELGADVPACLLSLPARGEGVGERLEPVAIPELSGAPVLIVNPGLPLSTPEVFARWDGKDRGPLGGDWRAGRNDLEPAAIELVREIADVLEWLRSREGVDLARMSGSGASCFALFHDEASLEQAALQCPEQWWHLATRLR